MTPVKSRTFSALRSAHHREKAEDYVEMILELTQERGEARLTDIARRFGVSAVTAHKIVDRLQREGFVTSEPYHALFLTARGKRLAVKSFERHNIVLRTLCALGVPEAVARIDAEGIEHHASRKTLAAFRRFLKRATQKPPGRSLRGSKPSRRVRERPVGSRKNQPSNKGLKWVLVFFLTTISSVSFASESFNLEHALVTDRPDTAESSLTVGQFRFQMETSFQMTHDRSASISTRDYHFPTLLRFGVTDPVELRVEGDMLQVETQTGSSSQTGFTDFAVGTKWHLQENEGVKPSLGFLAHLLLPTGKEAFSANGVEPEFKVLMDWALPENFSLGTNAGFDVPVRDAAGDKYARFLYAVALGYTFPFLTGRLRIFGEFAGAAPSTSGKASEHTFDTGLALFLTKEMQVDGFVNVGITNAAPDVTAGVGFCFRL